MEHYWFEGSELKYKQNSPKTRYKLQMNGCTRQRLLPGCLMTKINHNLVVVDPDSALGRPQIVFRHDARLGMKDEYVEIAVDFTHTSMNIPAVWVMTPCK
jgi:hypothetical protein